MRYLRAFGRFWWEFVIGDTPEIAVGVAAVLGIAFAISGHRLAATILVPIAVVALLAVSVLRGRRVR